MIVVLMGYMGSGKSTLGRALSEETDLRFLDLDTVIEAETALSIAQIIDLKGHIYFRKLESELLKKTLSTSEGLVLAVGGGTPCYAGNLDSIKAARGALSIYLKLSIAGLAKRLAKEKQHRPLIKDIPDQDLPEFIGKHLFERSPFYQNADHTIDCEGKSPAALVAEIVAVLGKVNGERFAR